MTSGRRCAQAARLLQYAGEGHRRTLDALVVALAAGVELGPDLAAVVIEEAQGGLDLGTPEQGGVGDDDDARVAQRFPPLAGLCLAVRLRRHARGLGELARRSRFAIAAECDVVDAPELGRRVGERTAREQPPAGGLGEHMAQLDAQHREIDRARSPRDGAVDAAVDAVEVAGLVGV